MSKQESATDAMLKEYENRLREAEIEGKESRVNQMQNDIVMQEQNAALNSINEQLDAGEVLDMIHHLLKGHLLVKENGVSNWKAPQNNDLVVLSDYGISYVMGMLQGYLNKNTLLSNYDEDQINQKMLDFSTTLADDIFMEYDKMFLEPTLEECKDEIKRRIRQKVDMRAFAMELAGVEGEGVDKDKIEEGFIKEMEGRIEREMTIIKEQKRKNKLKRFESLIRMIQDTVHSAYQRAWRGQERTSARSHMHITENKGGMVMAPQQKSFNPLGILKGR